MPDDSSRRRAVEPLVRIRCAVWKVDRLNNARFWRSTAIVPEPHSMSTSPLLQQIESVRRRHLYWNHLTYRFFHVGIHRNPDGISDRS